MEHYIFSTTGWIHFLVSVIALVTGTMILVMKKGTKRHKQVGYVYALAMVGVVATAFMIYRLFGGWGIFHWAAVVSGLTLAGGMIPALIRRPENWLHLHFSLMYWSVMGLYMAFISEILTRIPETPPVLMLNLSMGVTGLIAGIFYYYRKSHWAEQFGKR